MTSKILIIIPVYNEQGNIKPIIKGIFHHFKKRKVILFINDNSEDKTQLEIRKYQKKYKNIFLENRKSKLGIGSAHKFGFKWALKRKYKKIVTMDCDGTHNPKYINQMINLLIKKNFDIVSTNRFLNKNSLKNWSTWRKFLTKLRHIVIKNLFRYLLKNHQHFLGLGILQALSQNYYYEQSFLLWDEKNLIDQYMMELI